MFCPVKVYNCLEQQIELFNPRQSSVHKDDLLVWGTANALPKQEGVCSHTKHDDAYWMADFHHVRDLFTVEIIVKDRDLDSHYRSRMDGVKVLLNGILLGRIQRNPANVVDFVFKLETGRSQCFFK